MLKTIIIGLLYTILGLTSANSAEVMQSAPIEDPEQEILQKVEPLIQTPISETKCATDLFTNALKNSETNATLQEASEIEIEQWIRETFANANLLQSVLQCPEFQNLADDDQIRFLPIVHQFPNGREITINYETQPKILKHRITIATKRNTADLNPSPKIGDLNDASIWVNTDPAWYGIMVVEAGALDNFVGPDKNNTISLEYIYENIDKLYPKNFMCTSKSALAMDDDMLNRAMHETVNVEGDTNDYYVAGDINLGWIGYAEVALDVAITIITWGTGTTIIASAKAARASRALKNLTKAMKTLAKSEKVTKYIKLTNKITKYSNELADVKDFLKLSKDLDTAKDSLRGIDRVKDAAKYIDKEKEIADITKKLDDLKKAHSSIENAKSTAELERHIKTLENVLESFKTSATELEKLNDVKKYSEARKSYAEINKYRNALKGLRLPQRGNITARAARFVKGIRATTTGGKKLDKAARLARSSIKSGRTRDWLFHSTMKNASILGRVAQKTGILYGAIQLIGNTMYDFTETSTGDFTNNIEFMPFLLLSADDIQGQENEINYGMWLLWSGDSISAVDDDAAYLQAMDFAAKFHEDLDNMQQENNSFPCNVDIYVVRPIIRNPDLPEAELYYLIMNDQPWTTAI